MRPNLPWRTTRRLPQKGEATAGGCSSTESGVEEGTREALAIEADTGSTAEGVIRALEWIKVSLTHSDPG